MCGFYKKSKLSSTKIIVKISLSIS